MLSAAGPITLGLARAWKSILVWLNGAQICPDDLCFREHVGLSLISVRLTLIPVYAHGEIRIPNSTAQIPVPASALISGDRS